MIYPGEIFVINKMVCAVMPVEVQLSVMPMEKLLYSITELKTGNFLSTGTLEKLEEVLRDMKANRLATNKDIDMLAEQKAKQIMSKYVEGIFNNDDRQSYETLARKIISRFSEIGIVKPENAKTQFMKVAEELGELAEGINKDKPEQVKDSLGDVLVTLILLAEDLNLNLLDCLNSAWNEIKDRKGEVKNGSFVKEADLNV
ncbi:MazG nucleotide pyrophosphohydrolase domain-containing protein [Ligilactobacillus agilis]|uniref:MazG nucleotide pyrophosphohydrolase domain-containing protein n=1 Tax=Ligilactobacillus agilis TaxID=1601 RepID=UPI0024320C7E|nr:MazG nucleotide pyrophosphohydrolase domain-containing protein [Ligilactobacillus agilis]